MIKFLDTLTLHNRIARRSVSHMADLMNVSQPTITRWENGTIDVPSSVLIRFITALGISLADFFAGGLISLTY